MKDYKNVFSGCLVLIVLIVTLALTGYNSTSLYVQDSSQTSNFNSRLSSVHTDITYNKAIITLGDNYEKVEVESWSRIGDSGIIIIRAIDGRAFQTASENIVLISDLN